MPAKTYSRGGDAEKRAISAEHLGNVRAGLEWCYSDVGDTECGAKTPLTAATRVFIEFSLLSECCRWAERALSTLHDDMHGSRYEMELQAALGYSLMFTKRQQRYRSPRPRPGLAIAEELK